MVVTVNGEAREVGADRIDALLEELGYEGSHLAVALNQELVRRVAWRDVALSEGDRIEIVTPRQGG